MTIVYLIGHRNPDTDSIASPIAYAHYKNVIEPDVQFIPTRLGPPNRETSFVLDYFQVPAPMLLENVYTQVRDLAFDPSVNVNAGASMRQAWDLMVESGYKNVTVVDRQGKLTGIVTLGDIAEAYLESDGGFVRGAVPVENIAGALKGAIVVSGQKEFQGIVEVASQAGTLTDAIGVPRRGAGTPVLVIAGEGQIYPGILDTPGTQVVVIAGGATPAPGFLSAAEHRNVTVISTPYATYEVARRVSQSEPVSHFMTSSDLIAFSLDELVDDIKETMLRYKYRSFPVLDENGRPVGKIGRRHVLDYSGKNVILVDHNEMSQSVEGIEEARILEIIDHHRIGAVETDQPIVFVNRPLGCTSTIIDELYRQQNIVPPKEIAGLMCAAILSDTLAFKSPTSTEEDEAAALRLGEIAGIDIEEFVKAMFSAGTSIEGKTESEVFFDDFKEFRIRKLKIGVSQVNIYHTDLAPLRQRLYAFMHHLQAEREYDLLLLMLTDIIGEGSEFLVVGSQAEIIERAFGVSLKQTQTPIFLPGVISRKKQVIPRIIRAINAM